MYLLRSPELDVETYRNVLHLLRQFRGPVQFLETEADAVATDDDPPSLIVWKGRKKFERMRLHESCQPSGYAAMKNEIVFPFEEPVKSWDELFLLCTKFRVSSSVPAEDLVMLLTDVANDMNWFGGVSPGKKDFFIHTAHWEHFFGQGVDIRFPIAYEVAVWVQRYVMFDNPREMLQNIHVQPLGCINDFCRDKSQIVLKMRTADMCPACMNSLAMRDVPAVLLRQFFDILDGIRTNMTFRSRSTILHRPSRVEIRGHTMKIFLTDLGDLELRLNPKEKALYLLFLRHPEGIALSEVQDYKPELKTLYERFCTHGSREQIDKAIDLLANPAEDNMNTVLSRIKAKLLEAVGPSLLSFYVIDGERGGRKVVRLERELVKFVE